MMFSDDWRVVFFISLFSHLAALLLATDFMFFLHHHRKAAAAILLLFCNFVLHHSLYIHFWSAANFK